MGAAKKLQDRTVVGVSFRPDELKDLDRQRAGLRTRDSGRPSFSRAAAVKLLWKKFGDDAATTATRQQSLAEADAQAAQPLIDDLTAATEAWNTRAHQRRMIGAHANQIAKFANNLLLTVRDGGEVSDEDIGSLVLALQGIERRLDVQAAAEHEDDQILAAVRTIVDQIRTAS